MNNKQSKHLVKTRQQFKDSNAEEVKEWKRLKQMKDKERISRLQKQEMETINKQLIDLREEYRRICGERGRAHKWATIVSKQETERQEFEKRRNKDVMKRSQQSLNQFITQNNIKQNDLKIEKENQILKRKQLMKSSLYKQNVAEEDVHILRQLQSLQKSEDLLREVIEKKREVSHSEESIERNAERLFWPKKLVPKQDFLRTQSVSSINLTENSVQNNDTKDSLSVNRDEEVRDELQMSVNTEEYLPTSIAIKLYERLKNRRKNVEQKSEKIYRNAAISTDSPIKPAVINVDSNDSESEQNSSETSCQTSYLSVPMASNRGAIALSDLYRKHLLTKGLNDMRSDSSVSTIDLELQNLSLDHNMSQSLDPLIHRINNLKELIEQKVGHNMKPKDKSIVLSDSHCYNGNSKPKHMVNGLNGSEYILNGHQNYDLTDDSNHNFNSDTISSISSSSFKTLQGMSRLDALSPSLQVLSDLNTSMALNGMNGHSLELIPNGGSDSIESSLKSQPIRDRNAFWKDVFERAGIEIDTNRIDDYLSFPVSESEPSVDSITSFSLKSFSFDMNSHSTPKR